MAVQILVKTGVSPQSSFRRHPLMSTEAFILAPRQAVMSFVPAIRLSKIGKQSLSNEITLGTTQGHGRDTHVL
jgi:hypothetical protein